MGPPYIDLRVLHCRSADNFVPVSAAYTCRIYSTSSGSWVVCSNATRGQGPNSLSFRLANGSTLFDGPRETCGRRSSIQCTQAWARSKAHEAPRKLLIPSDTEWRFSRECVYADPHTVSSSFPPSCSTLLSSCPRKLPLPIIEEWNTLAWRDRTKSTGVIGRR